MEFHSLETRNNFLGAILLCSFRREQRGEFGDRPEGFQRNLDWSCRVSGSIMLDQIHGLRQSKARAAQLRSERRHTIRYVCRIEWRGGEQSSDKVTRQLTYPGEFLTGHTTASRLQCIQLARAGLDGGFGDSQRGVKNQKSPLRRALTEVTL